MYAVRVHKDRELSRVKKSANSWALTLGLLLPDEVIAQPDPGADANALPKVPPGFEVKLFAKEPLVHQPCFMAFDPKGRFVYGSMLHDGKDYDPANEYKHSPSWGGEVTEMSAWSNWAS